MTIAVAYKWAPNPQDAAVQADGSVDWSRAKAAISAYDPVAVEVARQLADALGTELVGLSVGGAEAGSPMARKAALSRGLDRLVVVADDDVAGAGSTRTALLLADLVRRAGDIDAVFTGDASVDVGAQMVPAILGGALGWPTIANVTAVTGTPGDLRISRTYAGGSQVLRVTCPVVLSVAADALVPRVPGMKDILAAGKKPTEDVPLAAVGGAGTGGESGESTVEVLATSRPQLKARKRQVIDASDPDAAAAELVGALRADNVI